MTALLRHKDTPVAVLRAAAHDQPFGLRAHTLLANQNTPPDALDRILARHAHEVDHTLRGELAAGDTLAEVLAGYPLARGTNKLATSLALLPDPDGEVARILMTLSPTASDTESSDIRIGRAWRKRWITIATRPDVPEDVRLDAAAHAASATMLTPDAQRRLVEVAADNTHWLPTLLSAARGTPQASLLRLLTAPPRTVANALDVLRNNPTREYTYATLAKCGPERHVAAQHAAADVSMSAEVLTHLAVHNGLPAHVRIAAASALDLRLLSPEDLEGLSDLIVAGAPAALQLAHQRQPTIRWRHAMPLAAAKEPHPHVIKAMLDAHAGGRGRTRPSTVMVALALNPYVRVKHRERAAELALQFAPEVTAVPALLQAGQLLPDRAAAGGVLPLSELDLLNGYGVGTWRLLGAAVGERAPAVQDPDAAAALVRLAPKFTGTVDELFTTATSLAL